MSWFEDCGPTCSRCGCDDMHACMVEPGVACHWVKYAMTEEEADDVEPYICSACDPGM